MLYVGKCHLCGFLLMAEDVLAFKQKIASHFDKSHRIDFGAFVADVPLRDFEEVLIFRVRDSLEVARIKEAVKNPKFWHSYRNHARLAKAIV